MTESKKYTYQTISKLHLIDFDEDPMVNLITVPGDWWYSKFLEAISYVEENIESYYDAILLDFSPNANPSNEPDACKLVNALPSISQVRYAKHFEVLVYDNQPIVVDSLQNAWNRVYHKYSRLGRNINKRQSEFTITATTKDSETFTVAEVLFNSRIETPVTMRWVTF